MARTENRTEFHRKLAEQIRAIESVAKETQGVAKETQGVATETKGVASAITGREDSMANIPDLVILLSALVRALVRACFETDGPPLPINAITLNNLVMSNSITQNQGMALSKIGFSDTKVQELYCVICPDARGCPERLRPLERIGQEGVS